MVRVQTLLHKVHARRKAQSRVKQLYRRTAARDALAAADAASFGGAAQARPRFPRTCVAMPVLALGTGDYDNTTAADAIEKAFAAIGFIALCLRL